METSILSFENLSFGAHELTLSADAGESLIFEVDSDVEAEELLELLLSLRRPKRGTIVVAGEDSSALSPKRLAQLRSRIGVVPIRGGLLSNLNLWENLVLPLDYHQRSLPLDRLRSLGEAALQLVGYRGSLTAKSNALSPFERRQIMIARGILGTPSLFIYAASDVGLSHRDRDELQRILSDVQAHLPATLHCYITVETSFGVNWKGSRRIELQTGEGLR